MKKHAFLALALLTGAALAIPAAAQAQSHQSTAGTSTAKPAAKKHPAKKHAEKKPHHKAGKGTPHKTAAKAAPAQTPAQQPSSVQLSDAEQAIGQQIYTGTFSCELGEKVTVTADADHPGFFTVVSGKHRYYMHPVESRTGAIRMEDDSHGGVWLQLRSKSELLDQKLGQRMADECKAPEQKNYTAHVQEAQQQKASDKQAPGEQLPDHAADQPASAEQPAAPPADVPASSEQPAGGASDAPASGN